MKGLRSWRQLTAAALIVSGAALIISGGYRAGGSERAPPTPTPGTVGVSAALSRSVVPSRAPTATPPPTPEPTPAPPPTPSPSPSPLAGLAPPVMAPGAVWTGSRPLPILMYHYVGNRPPADDIDAALTVTEADFTRQMRYLRCAGYYSITLTQLFDAMHGGAPLPEKPIILTFDDGYRDAYTDAFPLIRAAGFGGSFGIVTDWVGHPDYMNWDQLREMAAAGMEIISHSASHPDLGREPDDIVRDQLGRSKRVLEEQLGLPAAFFMYPAGEPFRFGTAARQAQVAAMVQEAGYRGALTARFSMWQDPFAPYALNRVRISGGIDVNEFANRMWGPQPDATGC